MELAYTVKILEQCQVSPPPGSVPPTSLPLTFFDIPMLSVCHMQRLFFYEFPYPTHHFTQTILPTLKHSLSLTLQHFFPFAGNFIYPPQPHKPHLFYTDGDSLPLTVTEADGDFNHLIANYPRDVKELHFFVPRLPPARVSADGTRALSLMVVQVTVFPNSGICIGVTFDHAACDGRSFNHFMKSWASVCRSRGDLTCLGNTLPFHNRKVIKDPHGILNIFLKDWWNKSSNVEKSMSPNHIAFADKVRVTLVFGRAHIEKLKRWITVQYCTRKSELEPLHVSTFVAVCAFLWVCMIKSRESNISDSISNDEPYHFGIPADCSSRSEFSIPTTYFGNCLAICYAQAKRGELMGENGIVEAAKAIGTAVKGLESGVLRGAEKWLEDLYKIREAKHLLVAAGSPRLRAYETDFGWGRPKKSEVVHIDVSRSISLNESRDEEGGVEIGLVLVRDKIDSFNAVFQHGLELFMS